MLKRIKKDDRGFTLVELIVCILMMSMITGMVVIFVVSSTKSYNLICDEVSMQTEADVAMTFINEIAVEAKDYAATGSYDYSGITCNAICLEAPDPDSLTDAYCYYIIWHQNNDNVMRFCKILKSDTDIQMVSGRSEIESVDDIDIHQTLLKKSAYGNVQNFLAQYVTEFKAVPPTDNTFPVLQVSIKLEFGSSSFVSTKNIASRNIAS